MVLQGARIEAEDKDGRSVLLLAAARAAWKAVLVLLRVGADVHHRDNCSRNILHHIVISGGVLDNFTQDIEKVRHYFPNFYLAVALAVVVVVVVVVVIA